MKIFIACDSYKGCMSSKQVNEIIKKAALDLNANHEVFTCSMGDGGEGTVSAFVEACDGSFIDVEVHDAYFKRIKTQYGLLDKDTAVIEVASCIGLNMYERNERHPMYATSYGVGELLLAAKKQGVKKIIVGLGGSSTNDGGMGLLQALGVKFYDKEGNYLKSNASQLQNISSIDLSTFDSFEDIEIIAACDVKNKLLYKQGATYIFGKQKGLFPNQIKKVDKAMEHYAKKFMELGYDIANHEGSGAAGGIGAALTLLNVSNVRGFDLLRTYTSMDEQIKKCDLVITGEGQSDVQTMFGKVPHGVIGVANEYKKPCICISGALGLKYKELYELGFIGIYSVADRAMSFAQALAQAPEKLYAAAFSILKTITYFAEDNHEKKNSINM